MSRAIVAVAVLSMAMSWASEAAAEKPAALSEVTSAKFVDTPLNDAMRSLAKQHKIEIRVDEASLTDIGIALDEPMNLKVEGVTLESLLAELLLPLGLTTVILQDGAVEVTTFEIADERVETRRYDLSPITGVYAVDGKQFLDSIYDATDGQWKVLDGIGGKASIEGNTLTVEQVARVHDQIERLLAQITRIVNPEQGPPLTATEKKELAIRERLSQPVTLQTDD